MHLIWFKILAGKILVIIKAVRALCLYDANSRTGCVWKHILEYYVEDPTVKEGLPKTQ